MMMMMMMMEIAIKDKIINVTNTVEILLILLHV